MRAIESGYAYLDNNEVPPTRVEALSTIPRGVIPSEEANLVLFSVLLATSVRPKSQSLAAATRRDATVFGYGSVLRGFSNRREFTEETLRAPGMGTSNL